MTAEELQRRTALWFTYDDQDQPEIAIEPSQGRAGAVFAFLRSHGGQIDPGASFWDPVSERDVPVAAVANAGEELDAGRAQSFVVGFRGIRFGGVRLPEVALMAYPDDLSVFWDAGPAWSRSERVAAFFDLLAALESACSVRLSFAETDDPVKVGPPFGAVFAEWRDEPRCC